MTCFGPLIISLSTTKVTQQEASLLADDLIGGIIFFKENIQNEVQFLRLIDTVKSINPNLLLFIDQEGGKVKRLNFPPFDKLKSQYEYGERGINEYITELKITNNKLQDYGIHVNFAPTLDSYHANSPIIGALKRSFTNDTNTLYNLASRVYKSQREINMPTVAKHFPDHGFTKKDSHLTLPKDNRNISTLMKHVNVYKDLISDNLIDIIMPAHIIYENIDNKNPTTLSKTIINDLLREQMNFNGVIISDCITMDALNNISKDIIINRCLEIGFDAIIMSHQDPSYTQNILGKIKSNSQKSKERLNGLLAKPTRDLPELKSTDIELDFIDAKFGKNQTVL